MSAFVSACSHPQPAAPPPAPVVAPAPAPASVATLAPTAAAGTWRLTVAIQSGNRPEPRNPRAVQPAVTLGVDSSLAPSAEAPAPQHLATITMPGYTRSPRRGRAGQAATWWPVGSDSLVVEFSQGARSRIQLRGQLQGASMHGDIWFVSSDGSSFQLGTFSAAKNR